MIQLTNLDGEIKKVAVIGFGYVGINVALFLCEKGLDVIGIDIDENLVNRVNKGLTPIKEVDISEVLKKHIVNKKLYATTDISKVKDAEVIIITVGTPLDKKYCPNLEAIKNVTKSIGLELQQNQIVIVKSTVVPGTTEEIVKPLLEKESGLKAGKDFVLSFCPERLAEGGSMINFTGSAMKDLKTVSVIVSGYNKRDAEIVVSFWNELGLATIAVNDFKTAEMAKLADNLWIDINIALANELALICEKVGIDVLDVISAANTLPKGSGNVNILYPGIGVGGYCLPKDPWFVYELGKKYGLDLKTPKASRDVNDSMPDHVGKMIIDSIYKQNKEIKNSKVTILGLSFKNSTGDMRNTPVKPIIEYLKKYCLNISAFDPWVDKNEATNLLNIKIEENLEAAVRDSDCIVIASAHPEFRVLPLTKMKKVASMDCIIIDGRNALDEDIVKKSGFLYTRIGLGKGEK